VVRGFRREANDGDADADDDVTVADGILPHGGGGGIDLLFIGVL
jgi:hypothetical protein